MKRFLTISTLILIYFLSCSKSCDDREQFAEERANRRAEAEKDSIASVFEKGTPEAASIAAFSEDAKLKLSDLSDYLKILTDTTLEETFRTHAGKMVCDLFVSSNTELFFTRKTPNGPKSIRAGQLAKPDRSILNLLKGFTADSVMADEPLTRMSDTVYSGTLSFLAGNSKLEPKITHPEVRSRVEMHVIRRNKIFGKDTLRVWNVYLGEMEIR